MLIRTWKDFVQHPSFNSRLVRMWWGVVTDDDMLRVGDRDALGYTLLHHAVMGCLPTKVQELIDKGADVNAMTPQGNYKPHHMIAPSLLHLDTTSDATKNDLKEVIRILIRCGAEDAPAHDMTLVEMINVIPLLKQKMNDIGCTELLYEFKAPLVQHL